MNHTIYIPEICEHCGFDNMKLFGTRQGGVIAMEVRCIRCGRILWGLRLANPEEFQLS